MLHLQRMYCTVYHSVVPPAALLEAGMQHIVGVHLDFCPVLHGMSSVPVVSV